MSEHLVPAKPHNKNQYQLREFADQVEAALAKARGPKAMVHIVCRLLTNKDPRIASLMACKWVEWRYGKARENDEGRQALAIQIINHVPRPGDASEHDTSAGQVVTEYSDKPEAAPAPRRLVINDQVSVADGDQAECVAKCNE